MRWRKSFAWRLCWLGNFKFGFDSLDLFVEFSEIASIDVGAGLVDVIGFPSGVILADVAGAVQVGDILTAPEGALFNVGE